MGPFRVRWGSNPFISFPEGWAKRISTQKRSLSHPQTEDRKAAPFQRFWGILPPASIFIIPPPLLRKEGQESAAKMHHVHRRGRITSRDGAWGILLSHEIFRRALRRRKATGKLYQKPGRSVNSSGTAPAEKHRGLAPCVPPPPPSPTKTGKDRATRKAEQGLRRSIPKVPKSTDKASIFEKGADAWGNPARQCPIKEKRHGKRG